MQMTASGNAVEAANGPKARADCSPMPQSALSAVEQIKALRMRFAIEAAVSQVFGVEHEALATVTRGIARVALARQVAMYLAHVGCGLSMRAAGALFGRDRTTVAHACLIVEDRRDDPMFDRALDLLEWVVPVMVLRPDAYLDLN